MSALRTRTTRSSQFVYLRPGHAPQELILDTTGKAIADGFIRSYAICRTPAFLIAEIRRTTGGDLRVNSVGGYTGRRTC